MHPKTCVILVPVKDHIAPECERSLDALERLGYQVRRVQVQAAADLNRCNMARSALESGFDELMWIDPDIAFDAGDVEKLRRHDVPLVCGVYPSARSREMSSAFLPGTEKVEFGHAGGLLEILYAGFGFVLTRRSVFEATRRKLRLGECKQPFGPPFVPWFMPLLSSDGGGQSWYLTDDFAFCERARRCEVPIMADTSIRLWRMGSYSFGWEDAGSDKERFDNYTFHLPASPPRKRSVSHKQNGRPAKRVRRPAASKADPLVALPRNPLHGKARRLPSGFPRMKAYMVSYAANHESMAQSLESFRKSDWGEEPNVFVQPSEWPIGLASASNNYKRAMEAAIADGCDFALLMEDDVRLNRWLRRNLTAIPLLARDQCDCLSLFMPDLIASPWERHEPHLGYRLAKPLYYGPNQLWTKYRLWGSQAYVLSRRLILAALERWDRLNDAQDTKMISVCSEFRLPMWYTAPCLAEHAPLRSAFGTPTTTAPDFDTDFLLEAGPGFHAPEEIPGWLTLDEGKLLWQQAAGRRVLELGTAAGRSTVCLGQQASHVVTVDRHNQTEAREWVRRYGLSDRVTFCQSDAIKRRSTPRDAFDLIFVDTEHDASSVRREIESALPLLAPGGRLAFHDYPDPGWPEVRQVVDEFAGRFGWKRIAQADYVGVFQT